MQIHRDRKDGITKNLAALQHTRL